jgi:hypothetical protein
VVESIELKVWKAELRSKPPGKVCLSCAAVSYDTEATAHAFILPSTTRRARERVVVVLAVMTLQ